MPSLFDKTEEYILNLIKEQSEISDDLIVVGKFVNYKGKDSFINIRNKNFVPLTYVGQGNEHIGKKIKIEIRENHQYHLVSEWYEFKIKLAKESLRRRLNNPTLITIDLSFEPKIYQPKEKEFVLNLYRRKSNQSLETDRGNIQSLRIIEREINRVKEAFIYELLQNADDYPLADKKVEVKIFTTTNEFIFSHNGSPFKFNNVYAICNINDGDKQDDADKIGYKGIGFKSVFAYSEKVLIKSGNYIFKFDKEHSDFQREKPFQIIPIWIEDSSVLNDLPIIENVNIVIKAKQGTIQIEEWEKLLQDIFLQESSTPAILFLRNIKNVYINQDLVSQTKSEWWINKYKLKLTDEIKSDIKRYFENNTGNIPEKLVGVNEIEIQFSLKHLNYEINPLPEAILYNYLPTKVNLGFTFLVNSDFIPTGDRHYLFENEWNKYLMKEVARKFFDWLNTLFNVRHKTTEKTIFKKDYLKLLPSLSKNIQELKSKTSNNLFLLEAFKEGFDLSIKGDDKNPAIPFIPTQDGTLETLSNILIDETGLADLMKEEFSTLTGIKAKLIHNEVGEGIEKIKALITEYRQGTLYRIDDLKADLKKTEFKEWLKIPANNFKLIQLFSSKEELQNLLENEKIILSESNQLFKASTLFRSVPDEVTFLYIEKISSELLTLLNENNISLALEEFKPVQFFKGNILGNQKNVNAALNNEANLLNLWKFIFNNWSLFEKEKEITNSLQHFDVLCKPKNESELSKSVISSAYLSAEFTSTNEIESVVKEINTDAVFISEKYLSNEGEKEKWRKIFKEARAITDLQKVIEVLITKLSTIEDLKHFEIAKQIFKYWKDNKEAEKKLSDDQIELIKANLKIKCGDNEYRNTAVCFISDHYNNNHHIATWLPNIELTNQVSKEYAPNVNQVAEWKNFLVLIGCIELADKQKVFDAKINFYINNQDSVQANHFAILKSISDLYRAKKENGLNFDFENLQSKIKLQTSNDEWHLPCNIHLSNTYNPKLKLENDEEVNSNFRFLGEEYYSNEIDKYFLKEMGVNDSFKFSLSELNQIDLNYKSLLSNFRYSEIFWNEVKKPNYKHLKFLFLGSSNRTTFNSDSFENFVVNYLKQNATLPNQGNELKKPTELFSFLLYDYITDKNDLPKFDLSKIYFDNEKSESLEDVLEIQNLLSQKHCIELLSRTENRVTLEQIKELKIIEILSGYIPTDEEKEKLFLLNKNLKWKPLNKLFTSPDEQFQIEPTKHLHEDFYPIAGNFGIQELSEDNLVLKTQPKTPEVTDEIETFFRSKAKFIAFKIDHSNYEEVETDIIEKINYYEFYEVNSITKVFPEDSPIYEKGINFHEDENKVFYKGNWKTNTEVKDFLFQQIKHEGIGEVWFENLIIRWSNEEIIKQLNDTVAPTPLEWGAAVTEEPDNFSKELDASNIDLNVKIKIKQKALDIGGNLDENSQYQHNILAKIALLKHLSREGLIGQIDLYDHNNLYVDGELYKVYSSNAEFAHIQPTALLQLKQKQCKIAIYYGGKNGIKIFSTIESLFELNESHIFEYQTKGDIERLLEFLENNNIESYRYLLVNPNIIRTYKFLENKEAEIDNEASDLI